MLEGLWHCVFGVGQDICPVYPPPPADRCGPGLTNADLRGSGALGLPEAADAGGGELPAVVPDAKRAEEAAATALHAAAAAVRASASDWVAITPADTVVVHNQVPGRPRAAIVCTDQERVTLERQGLMTVAVSADAEAKTESRVCTTVEGALPASVGHAGMCVLATAPALREV